MGRTGTILDYQSYSDLHTDAENMDGTVRSAAYGRPAANSDAVQWLGPWVTPHDGLAEHTRRSALALHEAGELVQLTNNAIAYSVDEEVESQVRHLLDVDTNSFRTRIIQMVPTEQYISSFLTHRYLSEEVMALRNSRTIIYLVTEYEGIGSDMARLLNRAGQVWTTTERSRAMLQAGGVEASRLKVVPVPYRDNDALLEQRGKVRKGGPPRFLHIGKWEPRKAQSEILGAFLLAFRPGEAELLMKTSKYAPAYKGYPKNIGMSVETWLVDERVRANGWTPETLHPHVRMVSATVPPEKLQMMHRWSDVYVTLSHGEGWDMPAFDAKVAGNRMIYTASGGPEEFATSDDIAVPFEGLEACHPWYAWSAHAKWTVSRAEAAVDAFRAAAKRVAEPSTCVDSKFSSAEVGRHMRSLLAEIEAKP